jgi:tripartite-type tricarboxylate transporter receptor subunit TctC
MSKRVLVLATLWLAAAPAAAQDLAGKTITIVSPFAPGAVNDPWTRVIALKLQDLLHATVIVENKPGANTNIGALHVARSAPDGRTLMVAGTALTANVAFYKDKLPFDPLKDFTPVSMLALTNLALVANPGLNVSTLAELIALLKANPGKFDYASAGSGNMTHLTMEFFKLKAGVDVRQVPYRGAAQALNDVVGGHAGMMAINPGPLEAFLKSGRLRALAITGTRRNDLLPDVPTFNEAGVPMQEVDYGTSFGILGPAGLPATTVATLHKALSEALADPEVRATIKATGFQAAPSTPQQYADILRSQVEKWPPLIERAGLTLN